MSTALAFLILIALTNYVVIFFSCLGLHNYGAWLSKYHKVDLWLHRVLVSAFTCFLPATSFYLYSFEVFLLEDILHTSLRLSLFCRLYYRFRMVLPYMQHGQPLHP